MDRTSIITIDLRGRVTGHIRVPGRVTGLDARKHLKFTYIRQSKHKTTLNATIVKALGSLTWNLTDSDNQTLQNIPSHA